MTATPLVTPRLGQINEGMDSTYLARYWEGHALGFYIAWDTTDALRDKYVEARNTMYASPLRAEVVPQVQGFLFRAEPGRDWSRLWWACGVLLGYKQATAERDDAAECITCDARVLTLVDEFQECAFHGIKCDLHLNDLCDEGCWRHGNVSGVA